ncbi:hypothetical protein FD31_GL002657 [Companilactobacillus nantensis DSM 16982]|uniref:Single-stranded DNA-binding protein n=2 Tax=Companilactobacillus nantensis TaxID=305793 RepID=A0A0R1WHH0_9LACO|nr:hypothetical protein FD31_GL002657 [Companilactobacillus nantensis DSM 16982]
MGGLAMVETKTATTTLVQELTKIQKELDKIEKDGKNNRQGFDYVSESQVKSKLQNKLADHGIMIIPHYEILNTWNSQTNKGNTMNYVSVMGTFKLTNGSEEFIGSMPGIGMDSGDKAIYKAETGAQKNFLMQLFLMSTGDDPENDSNNNWNPQQQYQSNDYNQAPFNGYYPTNEQYNNQPPMYGNNNYSAPKPSRMANEAKKGLLNQLLDRLSKLNQTDRNTSTQMLRSHFPKVNFDQLPDSSADNMITFMNQQIESTEKALKQMGAF